jgi:hypothetical protein
VGGCRWAHFGPLRLRDQLVRDLIKSPGTDQHGRSNAIDQALERLPI